MLDRRLLAGIALAIVVVLSARQATTTHDPTTTPEIASAPTDHLEAPTPTAPVSGAPASLSAEARSTVPSATSSPSQPSTTIVSSSTTIVQLADLVAAVRPTLPVVEVVDDGHDHHDHGVIGDAGTIASHVVVTAWSWRFDADEDHVATGLAGFATAQVIASLTPNEGERDRRADAGEVAWVIVRNLDVNDELVTVTFDHHLVTSTKPETITTRHATIAVVDDLAVTVVEVDG